MYDAAQSKRIIIVPKQSPTGTVVGVRWWEEWKRVGKFRGRSEFSEVGRMKVLGRGAASVRYSLLNYK